MFAALVLAVVVPIAPVALVHHPVSTTVAAAQQRFDEGLTLVYSFNRNEARKRFEDAAALDPKLAMAWWGVALAVGPNVNESMRATDLSAASHALERARALEASAAPEERRYIEALAVRYPADLSTGTSKSYVAYRDAMKRLAAEYPNDLDAATLYAESIMDVSDFGFTHGVPTEAQTTIVAILNAVIARDPHHIGANHYLIHAWDYPGVAEHALASARYLSDLPYEPADSHLQHMPGHTYLDVGDLEDMLRVGRLSTLDDDAYAASIGVPPFDLRYYGHDLDFWSGAALLMGDQGEIDRSTAEYLAGHNVGAMMAYAAEGRYADVDAWPKPAPHSYATVAWYYARTLSALGRGDVPGAERDVTALDMWLRADSKTPDDVSADVLAHARLDHAKGDDDAAMRLLHHDIDRLADAPPEVGEPWFYPAARWIGDLLFERGDFSGAEAAYRAELRRVPNDPRGLYGLMRAYAHEGRIDDASALAPVVASHWRGNPGELHEPDL